MRRDASTTPEDLNRPKGNDLLSNYQHHDIAEELFLAKCRLNGLDVEQFGIDERHDDGDDGIIYDDKPDYKVYDGNELTGLVDVKSKTGPSFMGRFNERHYLKYLDWTEEVPVYVAMFQLYDDTIVDAFACPITPDSCLTTDDDGVTTFPDGNRIALVKHSHRQPLSWLVSMLTS
jgi:hypothetical protein